MIFKYIGCALILIFALVVSKEYKVFSGSRVSRLSEYLDFLSHIERRISTALLPQHRLVDGFSSKALEESFLPKLRECGELYSAYESAGGGICDTAHKILLSYFADFGKSDREGELSRVREAMARLRPVFEDERSASEKNIKLFETVAVAVALGLIILLI